MTSNGAGLDGGAKAVAVAIALRTETLRCKVAEALSSGLCAPVEVVTIDGADVLVTDFQLDADLPTILIANQPEIEAALRHGVRGGLMTSFTPAQLVIAIEAVANGLTCRPVYEHAIATRLDAVSGASDPTSTLTAREMDVLRILITGASNKAIARELDISVHTVKFHVASIVAKLGAAGRTDAILKAISSRRSMI